MHTKSAWDYDRWVLSPGRRSQLRTEAALGENYSADGLPIPKDHDHARFDPLNQQAAAAEHHAEHGDEVDHRVYIGIDLASGPDQTAFTLVTNPKDAAGLQKTRFDLIPWPALVQIMPVMAYGAAKYAPFNWRDKTIGRMNYIAAALRHLAADADGQAIDPDSGLPHLAHAAATLLVLLDAQANGTMVDDRVLTKGVAADLMAALNRPAKPT